MSIIGLSETEKMFKKSLHQRKDSGELDVFEAAKYFSGANEIYGYNAATFAQKGTREDRQCSKPGRFSFDMPKRNAISSQSFVMEKQMKEKKHKQPSSPGGKLANFLNSLFNQASSKKKKSKSSTQSLKDDHDDQSPGWRRKRRSSISHFRGTNNTVLVDSKSMYSSSSSGFRTPPPYAVTPTKPYKDCRSFSDHQQVMSFTKQNGNAKSNTTQNGINGAKIDHDYAWLDEKSKLIDENLQNHRTASNGFPGKIEAPSWADRHLPEEKEFRKFNEADDGADSDSSSDLFELPNYDLDFYSSGLPVYETTNMDSIKRTAAPISSASTRLILH